MNQLGTKHASAVVNPQNTKELIHAGVSPRLTGTGQVDKPREEQFPINRANRSKERIANAIEDPARDPPVTNH